MFDRSALRLLPGRLLLGALALTLVAGPAHAQQQKAMKKSPARAKGRVTLAQSKAAREPPEESIPTTTGASPGRDVSPPTAITGEGPWCRQAATTEPNSRPAKPPWPRVPRTSAREPWAAAIRVGVG